MAVPVLFGGSINQSTDTLRIEQTAFNYLVSNIDSIIFIDGSKRQNFNTATNKIYFCGYSSGKGMIHFAAAKFFKDNFLNVDSLYYMKDNPQQISSLTNNREPLTIPKPYVRICDYDCFKENKKSGDIFAHISNRFFHDGFYYVRINIHIGVDNIFNEVYFKLNSEGTIIDKHFTHGIE
jgi:hypothetical protein